MDYDSVKIICNNMDYESVTDMYSAKGEIDKSIVNQLMKIPQR
jgi:hypothetical protein